MFYRPTTRLLVVKFLGIFGSSQIDERKDIDGIKKTDLKVSSEEHHVTSNYKHAIETSSKKIVGLILEKGIPGLTICVSKKGQVVWKSAFGFCDVENQVECQPDARMRIASISKSLFAATIVAPLIDQNKIDIKSSIHKYLTTEEFPRQKYQGKESDITIEQLLSHTSGIRHYATPDNKPLRPIGSEGSQKVYQCDDQYDRKGFFQRKTYRSVLDALEPFKEGPLVSEPGKYKYTTYGYTLLSAVVEKVLQQTDRKSIKEQIEDYWMKVVQRDWSLEQTSLDQDEPILPKRARYYLRSGMNGSLINAPYSDNSVKWAGGGLVSTTEDLVKFAQLLIDSYKGRATGKFKRETVELLWKEVQESYALGFQLKPIDVNDDKIAVYHLGSALGASSALIIYPESEVVVAILTNLDSINLRTIGLFVAEQFARCV